MQKKSRLILNMITNIGLLLTGTAMALSGFVIQFGYHMGHHGRIDEHNLVLGMYYSGWSNSHKITIVIVSFLIMAHMALHGEWYKTVVKKNLFARNKLVVALTIIFIMMAVTGYISWWITLADGSDAARKIFVEVHDKLAFVLFACLIFHVAKSFRWFIASFEKMKKSGG